MASPIAQPAHPLTPPADPSPSQPTTAPTSTPQLEALLSQPLTSLSDNGSTKRPRDQRLIHLLLASHGIAAYQERVPLQLMDFAYRYTSSVLLDAQHVAAEGYDTSESGPGGAKGRGKKTGGTAGGTGGGGGGGGGGEEGDVSLAALRMSIASRMAYQFQGQLPKEFLKGLAEERNRVGLGVGAKGEGATIAGVRLPPEKYCLTGLGWGISGEWDSEGEEEEEEGEGGGLRGGGDVMQTDGAADEEDREEQEQEQEGGEMEDVFGEEVGDGGGGEDAEMENT